MALTKLAIWGCLWSLRASSPKLPTKKLPKYCSMVLSIRKILRKDVNLFGCSLFEKEATVFAKRWWAWYQKFVAREESGWGSRLFVERYAENGPHLRTSFSQLRTSFSELRTSLSQLRTSLRQLRSIFSQLRTSLSQLRSSFSQLRTQAKDGYKNQWSI